MRVDIHICPNFRLSVVWLVFIDFLNPHPRPPLGLRNLWFIVVKKGQRFILNSGGVLTEVCVFSMHLPSGTFFLILGFIFGGPYCLLTIM